MPGICRSLALLCLIAASPRPAPVPQAHPPPPPRQQEDAPLAHPSPPPGSLSVHLNGRVETGLAALRRR